MEIAIQQLTLAEDSRLSELEAIIEESLLAAGEALAEIRDRRLYKATHSRFDDYCRERWQMSERHANRKIQAGEVVQILGPVGPTSERQARELVPLLAEPEQLRETWAAVCDLHPEPTAADVREAVQRTRGQLSNQSGGSDAWSTPQDFFDELNQEFGFTLDVCATIETAKCESFFTSEVDGLSQTWRGACWMNPPYGGEIRAWVEKAWRAGQDGATVVCLVPARVDTGWWWNYCRHGDVRFLRGRLKFGNGENSAPFPSAVVVFPGSGCTTYWERETWTREPSSSVDA